PELESFNPLPETILSNYRSLKYLVPFQYRYTGLIEYDLSSTAVPLARNVSKAPIFSGDPATPDRKETVKVSTVPLRMPSLLTNLRSGPTGFSPLVEFRSGPTGSSPLIDLRSGPTGSPLRPGPQATIRTQGYCFRPIFYS
ncbi:MAG: hypothetical protein L6R35_005425, partial [Caloplaca aegaea]